MPHGSLKYVRMNQRRLCSGCFPIVKDVDGAVSVGGVVELGVECTDGVERRDRQARGAVKRFLDGVGGEDGVEGGLVDAVEAHAMFELCEDRGWEAFVIVEGLSDFGVEFGVLGQDEIDEEGVFDAKAQVVAHGSDVFGHGEGEFVGDGRDGLGDGVKQAEEAFRDEADPWRAGAKDEIEYGIGCWVLEGSLANVSADTTC